ncbi:hypothetical protein [Flagellimonas sp.]|uniref:hypothetical protein n=1 Tax=Flagellimonas sp. TaxID=2058762 RepID=UPI003B5B0245
MEDDHPVEIDLIAYVFDNDNQDVIVDISEWIAQNGLNEDLLKKIIEVLWKTIV